MTPRRDPLTLPAGPTREAVRADALIRLLAIPDDTADLGRRGHRLRFAGDGRRGRQLWQRLCLIYPALRRHGEV